jgi:fluoride exporter
MPVPVSIALFGALGALARYGVDLLVERHTESVFPLSTFVINISGCFLAGVFVGVLVDRFHEPNWLTIGAVTGFLGAYTTFSTFAYETHGLLRSGHHAQAAANVVASVVLGVSAVYLGLLAARA